MHHDTQNTYDMLYDADKAKSYQYEIRHKMASHHTNLAYLSKKARTYRQSTSYHIHIFKLTAEKEDLHDINKERHEEGIYQYYDKK